MAVAVWVCVVRERTVVRTRMRRIAANERESLPERRRLRVATSPDERGLKEKTGLVGGRHSSNCFLFVSIRVQECSLGIRRGCQPPPRNRRGARAILRSPVAALRLPQDDSLGQTIE